MTLKQTQRAGRLQKEGCLEYGADDSRSTTGGGYKRPLDCQEVSRYNQRNSVSLCNTLVQSYLVCWREALGRKNYKKESLQSISNHIRPFNKGNCFLGYVLDVRKKELQVRQGSNRNL